MDIIKKLRANIKSYNRHMTDEYLDSLTYVEQLRLTHPFDRVDLTRELKNEGIITDNEFREIDYLQKAK